VIKKIRIVGLAASDVLLGCCYACAPDQFKRASATVYYCENYIKLMEDEEN